MPEMWTTRLVGNGSSRAYRLVVNQQSLLGRVLIVLLMLALFALLAVIVVPIAVVGVVAFLGGAAIGRTRAWIRGLRSPNGMLDERRNVRVIVRD